MSRGGNVNAQNQIHGKKLLSIPVGGQTKNLIVLRGNGTTRLFEGHPLVETLNKEHGTGLSVISPKVADAALNTADTCRHLRGDFAVDAAIAYERYGARLGKEIVFVTRSGSAVVLATGKHEGKENVALVALGLSSADFKKDGRYTILDIHENRLIAVPDFPSRDPTRNSYYLPHAETGVPHGGEVEQSTDTRFLVGTGEYSPYVGLLTSISDIYGSLLHSVCAFHEPFAELGVVAEVPDADVPKIQALLNKQNGV
jgi:hypothetical protein